jgi:hypothetical protein
MRCSHQGLSPSTALYPKTCTNSVQMVGDTRHKHRHTAPIKLAVWSMVVIDVRLLWENIRPPPARLARTSSEPPLTVYATV